MPHRSSIPHPTPLVAAQLRTALLALAGVLVITAAAGQVLTLLRTRQLAQRESLGELATLAAAQIPNFGSSSGRTDFADVVAAIQATDETALSDAGRFGRALLTTEQVDALAITDADGAVAFYWPTADRPPAQLAIPHADDATGDPAYAANIDGMAMACAPISRADMPAVAGYACVFSSSNASAPMSALATPVTATCAVAVGAVLLAMYHLKRNVCDPLAQIHAAGDGRSVELPIDRDDELGAIARRFDVLRNDLELARGDARRVERSVEDTVNRETQHISQQLRRAQRSAEIDSLTGLANRRFIEERLEAVFSEQVSHEVNLAIVMLDVDNFKPLNDKAGHAAGDALLRFVGELLRSTLRDHDVGVRYGGDEFALVLVDVTGLQARRIAERIIRMFGQKTAAAKLPTTVTLSAGIASLDEVNARSGAELMARADDALYISKNQGKNVAISATDGHPLPNA
ncbi:MAG: diguanylate cyclase [Phycisphaerales bacterium]|nr:diguanylate cyclase [Phycisphaerales bacterium]